MNQPSYSPERTLCHTTKQEEDDIDDEVEDLELYYKVWNHNRPDPSESNAEAADRHQTIDDEYKALKREREINKT